MSFLPISEQNQQAPTGQTTPAPNAGQPAPQSGGSTGAGSPGGPKSASTGTPSQFGSSASKLGDYLSANAPQITQQAGQVTAGLNNQYDTLNQGITNAANQFGQQVSQGYAAPNQDVVNQAVANPTQFAQDPNNVKAFQAQYNNQYTGPQNFESTTPYGQIQGQVQNAVQQGGLLQTQAGLQSYLGGQQKNPTQASSTLDALLLRGNPEAQQQIQQAGTKLGTLGTNLQTATQAQDQGVQAAQQAAQNAQQYAQGQFNPYVQNFGNAVNQNFQNATTGQQQYNQGIEQTREQLNPWNTLLNAYDVSSGFNLDNPFAQYNNLQPVVQAPTAESVATPEQFAVQQALSQLGGQNYNFLNPEMANQAGTFNLPQAPNIDYAGLGTQIGSDIINREFGHTTTNTDLDRMRRDQADRDAIADLITKAGGQYNPVYR